MWTSVKLFLSPLPILFAETTNFQLQYIFCFKKVPLKVFGANYLITKIVIQFNFFLHSQKMHEGL